MSAPPAAGKSGKNGYSENPPGTYGRSYQSSAISRNHWPSMEIRFAMRTVDVGGEASTMNGTTRIRAIIQGRTTDRHGKIARIRDDVVGTCAGSVTCGIVVAMFGE